MASFEDLLKQLHGDSLELDDTESLADEDGYVEILPNRTFKPSENYNTMLAYEGDVNSQIVLFKLPVSHDGHGLWECKYKIVRWKNLANGTEGTNSLLKIILNEGTPNEETYFQWIIPPEVFAKAGTIEISLSLYDFDDDGKVGFAWNTPTFRGFSVGEANQQVGFDFVETEDEKTVLKRTPAKNEILFVDIESGNIVAPSGYDPVIGNYGNCGTAIVYFQMPRYVYGMDLLTEYNINSNAGGLITLACQYANGKSAIFELSHEQIDAYASTSSYGEGLVNFYWEVPNGIMCDKEVIGRTIDIAIIIAGFSGGKAKMWSTNIYKQLKIGESIFSITNTLPAVPKANFIISGGDVTGNNYATVSGIVTQRSTDDENLEGIPINKNELLVEYKDGEVQLVVGVDKDGTIVGENVGYSETKIYQFINNFITKNSFIIDANEASESTPSAQ